MRSSFIFNNMNSLLDFKVLVVKGPPYFINNESYEEVKIEGRSGSLLIKNGTYSDIILPFKLRVMSTNSIALYELLDNITEWLTTINNNQLIYDRNDIYYSVKRIEFGDIINSIYSGGEFELNFICEPFKYIVGETYTTLLKSTTLNYNGNAPGECNIKIYGSGNIQLTINDETVQINDVNEYVELDSKLLLCLNKDKTSKTRDMIGHFPLLLKGSNHISWEGNISKVEILPRTAYR